MPTPAMGRTGEEALAIQDAFESSLVLAVEHRIKTIGRPDGKARLYIIKRDDGRYRFEGEIEQDDGGGFGPYWMPCDISGLYATADEAEAGARRDVLWLRNVDSK